MKLSALSQHYLTGTHGQGPRQRACQEEKELQQTRSASGVRNLRKDIHEPGTVYSDINSRIGDVRKIFKICLK